MLAWLCMVAGALFSACSPAAAGEDEAEAAASPPPAVVRTVTLTPANLSQRRDGIANILAPGDLVDLDAEIRNAKIAIEFSTLQFERFKGSPSLPRITVENSERQLKTDKSQLERLKARLAHTWGETAPMIDDTHRHEVVEALAAGTKAIVRMDFPGGLDSIPRNVEIRALGTKTPIKVESVWQAPSGSQAMPGVSYFALIAQSAGLRPGDRAIASAETGDFSGIVIPNAAIVVTESASWCYVETKPHDYERKPVSLETPVANGYLVTTGFEPGMKVVVEGASSLLAREADPSSGGDDDDDAQARPAAKAKPKAAPETSEAPAAPKARDDDDDDEKAKAAAKPAHAEADLATGSTTPPAVDRN